MKAAYVLDNTVHVGEMPDPTPSRGQALVRTHSCGLCASDVHFMHSAQKMIELSAQHGGPYSALDLAKPFVMGHEFVGEVLDYGVGSRRPVKPGRRVTSIPIMRQGGSLAVIGYDNSCPGGFGEYMLLDEDMILEVPSGLPDDVAAMTEPLAVGLEHARRGNPVPGDVALVIGCGAIGLGVIAGLKLKGIAPIIAADFDEGRRAMAIRMGAHVAVDPREVSPYAPIHDLGGKVPNLVYECVGKPGLLAQIIHGVGFDARIVMGGYCLEPEEFMVFAAQNKRLSVLFAAGEMPEDMELAIRSISEGTIDVGAWLGGRIGLGEVGAALAAMSDPSAPIRTVVDPRML